MKTSRFLYQKLSALYESAVMSSTYNGKVITEVEDLQKLKDSYYLWCLTMWDFAAPLSQSRLYDTLPQLFLLLCRCDVSALVRWLDSVRSAFYMLPSGSSLAISLFKGVPLGGGLSSGHLIVPMVGHCDMTRSASCRALNSILSFILKLNISLDIEEQLEQEYIQDEIRLGSLSFPDSIVSDLNKIILRWFGEYRLSSEDNNPRHGPGAVATRGRIAVSQKYPLLGLDLRLHYFLSRDRTDYHSDYVRPLASFDRCSEVLFVPKSLKTYRVICKEPATLQYWQQYVASSLTSYIHDHPYLGKKIRLDDQGLSRLFCLEASKSGDYATIDLSKASDSVSFALVKRIFRGTTLLRALVATRSDSVRLPSGKTIKTAKFAPMGSALCFPIECIIFAALCELATAYSSNRHTRYRVYGDDLIIHRDHVSNLFLLLDYTGFLPNREKSYWSKSSPYRESCGMEAFGGQNISPVRLSRWFTGLACKEDRNIPRMVDLANTFYINGLNTARKAVVDRLIRIHYPPVFTVPYGIGLWSSCPTNFNLKRIEKAGQKWILHGSLRSKPNATRLANEDIRLHEWFRQDGSLDGTVLIERTRTVWQATSSPSWFSMIEVAGE